MDEIKKETELFTPEQFLDLHYRYLNYLVQSFDWKWVRDGKGWGAFEVNNPDGRCTIEAGLAPIEVGFRLSMIADDEVKRRTQAIAHVLLQSGISIDSVQKYPSICKHPLYWGNIDGHCLVCSEREALAQMETDDIKLDLDQAKRLHKELAKTRKRPNVVLWTSDGEKVAEMVS